MNSSEKIITTKDTEEQSCVKSLKTLLKEIKEAKFALRRIEFLSRTFNDDHPHLKEVAIISKNALNQISEISNE